MTRIVVMDSPEYAGRDLDIERGILGARVDIRQHTYEGNAQSIIVACRQAEVVLTDYVPFTRETLAELPKLKLISVAATGYDNVDVEAAREHEVSVCAIEEYCTDEVADHTLALILALGRRLLEYHAQVQRECLWRFDTRSGLARFREMTLGVIGYGRIGRAVAKRARAFGMTILAFDPYSDDATNSLDEIFEKSDVISLHCALTPETRHLIDAAAFEKMRRSPILINVARGELVSETDLVQALDDNRISAAALDVLEDESADLAGSKLLGRSNVILTPHVAFYSDASIRDNRELSAQNIRHFLDGEHSLVSSYVCRSPALD